MCYTEACSSCQPRRLAALDLGAGAVTAEGAAGAAAASRTPEYILHGVNFEACEDEKFPANFQMGLKSVQQIRLWALAPR